MNQISCNNRYNKNYFQCLNNTNEYPSAVQLGVDELKNLVPQFVNNGRFDVARQKMKNYLGVRSDNLPADVGIQYFGMGPSESFATYSHWN